MADVGDMSGLRVLLDRMDGAKDAASNSNLRSYSKSARERHAHEDHRLYVHYGVALSLRCCTAHLVCAGEETLDYSVQGEHGSDAFFTMEKTDAAAPEALVRFGDAVGVKSRSRKRYLAAADHKLELRRSTIGPAETWTLLALEEVQSGSTGAVVAPPAGAKATQTRVVRSGDTMLLRSSTGLFLGLSQSALEATREATAVSSKDHELVLVDMQEIHRENLALLCFSVLSCGAPYTPPWRHSRPFSSMSFSSSVSPPTKPRGAPRSLASFDATKQEALLVHDVLQVLIGFPGKYLSGVQEVPEPHTPERESFMPADGQNRSMRHLQGVIPSFSVLVERLLPAAESYVISRQFCAARERHEYGTCSQAFAAACRQLLDEFLVVVTQLENEFLSQGGLTLQRLWYLLQPSLRTLQILRGLCEEISEMGAVGGQLLNVIHAAMESSGVVQERKLLGMLMDAASAPYFELLSSWIFYGHLNDPYREFMIAEDDQQQMADLKTKFNAQYWESRHFVKKVKTPTFLVAHAEEILTAGRYLSSVRACGNGIFAPFPSARALSFEMGEASYGPIIKQANEYAGNLLLRTLLIEHNLRERLRVLKRYFLFEAGDCLTSLMDIAEGELSRDVRSISRSKVQSLLQVALSSSAAAEKDEAYRDEIGFEFSDRNLISHLDAMHDVAKDAKARADLEPKASSATSLSGFEAFTLDVDVPWPINIVLSRRVLTKYQLLFRHLFFAKHIERRLYRSWRLHQTVKELSSAVQTRLTTCFALRHRMLHFVQNLVYYMMVEVINPQWHQMEKRLEGVNNLDNLLKAHEAFQDACLEECLLTNQHLLRTLTLVMMTCHVFTARMEAYFKQSSNEYRVRAEASQTARMQVRMRSTAQQGGKGAESPRREEGRGKDRHLGVTTQRRARLGEREQDLSAVISRAAFVTTLSHLERRFDELVEKFIGDLWTTSKSGGRDYLANLCTRLDFNGVIAARFH